MPEKTMGYNSIRNRNLCILCWIAYASTYICRLNYSAVMPELSSQGIFPESRIAAVSSAFFMCYGIGQLFSGILGDKLSPRKMIFTGILVSSVSNVLISFFHSFPALLTLWAVNGVVQSMTWSPMLRIAGDNFSSKECEKFSIDIAATVPIGTMASYGISLIALNFLPWNYVFLVCGVFEFAAAMIWLFGTRNVMSGKKEDEPAPDAVNNDIIPAEKIPIGKLLKILAVSGIFLLMLSTAIMGTLKDSVIQWIPTFFVRQFNTGTNTSLALTMLLPVVNVTGAYFARFVNKYLRNELSTSIVFFGIAAAFLAVLNFTGGKNMILSLLLMAGVTNCMFAINVMLITLIPLRFSKFGCVSTVGGMVNMVAYVGCALLNLVAGAILEKSGSSWTALFAMWLILAISALAVTSICLIPWNRFAKKEFE